MQKAKESLQNYDFSLIACSQCVRCVSEIWSPGLDSLEMPVNAAKLVGRLFLNGHGCVHALKVSCSSKENLTLWFDFAVSTVWSYACKKQRNL